MTVPLEAYRLTTRFLSLKQGMHSIRYEAAPDQTETPFVVISAVPDYAGFVQMFSSGDGAGNALRVPGDVLIVKAAVDVKLLMTIAMSGSLTAPPPELHIERLDRAPVASNRKAIDATGRFEIVGAGPSSSSAGG